MSLYDGTNAPQIKVYLDTGNRVSGLFTLSWSELGGSDKLGKYTPFTSLTQFDSTDVKSVSIRRGRTREDQQIQPGVLTLSMDNTSGKYDPEFSKFLSITAASGSGSVVTYTFTSTNTLKVGDVVTVEGLSVSALNLKLQTVLSVTATQFTVTSSATGSCTGQLAIGYSGYGASYGSLLVAGTGIRVTGTIIHGGGPVEVSLFTGFIEQIEKDLSLEPVTTITCVDALARLSKNFLTLDTTSLGDSTAISQILDNSGWNQKFYGSSDKYIISAIEPSDALTMIDSISKTQARTIFFASADGDAVWQGYVAFDVGSWAAATKMFTLTDSRASNDVIEYDSIDVIGGEKYRRNQVTVHNIAPNGYENYVTKFNQASVAQYGPFAAQIDTYYSNPYVAEIAQNLADEFADSTFRVDDIKFECVGFSTSLWRNILYTDLGAAVSVSRTPIYSPNVPVDYQCRIQEINHDIKPDSWRMSLTLSPGL